MSAAREPSLKDFCNNLSCSSIQPFPQQPGEERRQARSSAGDRCRLDRLGLDRLGMNHAGKRSQADAGNYRE